MSLTLRLWLLVCVSVAIYLHLSLSVRVRLTETLSGQACLSVTVSLAHSLSLSCALGSPHLGVLTITRLLRMTRTRTLECSDDVLFFSLGVSHVGCLRPEPREGADSCNECRCMPTFAALSAACISPPPSTHFAATSLPTQCIAWPPSAQLLSP